MPRPFAFALLLVSPVAAPALTLEEAIALALERNERPAIASEQAAAAQARLDRARAFFFPEVAAVGNYTRRMHETVRDIGGQPVVLQARDALSASVVARWTVFDARGFPLYRTARLDRDASRLESLEANRLLMFEVADAYLSTLSAEQVASAAERRLELARKSHEEARARFEARLVGTNDVTRAELELATAQRESARAQAALKAAYVSLGYLLNAEVKPPLAAPDRLIADASGPLRSSPDLVAAAEAARLDVAAAESRAEAASALAVEPPMRLVPSISAVGQYRVTNEAGFTARTGDGFLGLELAWSLFDGGERYAEARERRALARASRQLADARRRRVSADVETALVSLETAKAALAHAAVAANVAQRNAAETAELYRQGLTGALEVSDAAVRLFEAEVALTRERYGMLLAFLDLRAALGVDPLGREVKP